jgi:hypothetical protein
MNRWMKPGFINLYFPLECSSSGSHNECMKNKNTVKTAEVYTYQQVDEAARVIQAYYTRLAERTAETNPQMSKDFNVIRLEMRNLRQVLND